MPGYLLDSGATVLCTHGGQASASSPSPRIRAGGQPITTQAAPHLVSGCPFNAGGSPMPCVTAQWTTAATRVRANGQPVLLQSSQATCPPNATPVTIVTTQLRVRGQ